MTLHPKQTKDLALAPVAAEIDANVERLRRMSPSEIDFQLELELDRAAIADDRHERAERVLAVAIRNVDLHGWHAEITEDYSAVRLTGGSVSLDISLGAGVERFIRERVAA